jgi:hypothetical protein
MADKHTAAIWTAGGALIAAGGIFMAVTGFEPTEKPRSVWANTWFDLGFAFVILGLLVTVMGVGLHFRKEVESPNAPPTINPDDLAQSHALSSPVLIVSGKDNGDGPGFHYESRNENGRIIIMPRDRYLDLLHSGGRITPVNAFVSPWRHTFKWPTLDIKLVNNGNNTLVFHEVTLMVKESRPDTRAVPLMRGIGDCMRVPLFNVGWGPMIDISLRFKLAPAEDADPVTPEFELRVDDIETLRQKGSLARFFADSGVDVEMLERLQIRGRDQNWYYVSPASGIGEQTPANEVDLSLLAGFNRISEQEHDKLRNRALGHFTNGDAVMRGTLEFSQNDANGLQTRQVNPFVATVEFGGPRRGAPLPPSWAYNVKLKSEGRHYTISKPISQTLKSGESDRFLLSLSADRSSFHEFSIKLVYNDNATLTSKPISLELFVSTLDARSVAKESSEIEHIGADR